MSEDSVRLNVKCLEQVSASHGAEKLLWVVTIRGVFLTEGGMTLHLEEQVEGKGDASLMPE